MSAVVAVFAMSCSNGEQQDEKNLDTALSMLEAAPVKEVNHTVEKEAEAVIFRINDREFTRILTVWKKSATEIKFKIAVMDADGDCDKEITGTAKSRGDDGEIRETDSGESLPADQYDYEADGCGISVLLEMNTWANAWIEQWDCPAHEGDCSFSTPLNLPRVD